MKLCISKSTHAKACILSILLNWNYCDLHHKHCHSYYYYYYYYYCRSVMSDDHNYFQLNDEESECPTEFREETVLTSATASECATASASVTTATSRPTRTLAKKANCSSLIWDFFSVLTQIQMDTILSFLWDWWILNDFEIALRNAHFRYRDSIEYRDTRDGIVIVAPISGIAQH